MSIAQLKVSGSTSYIFPIPPVPSIRECQTQAALRCYLESIPSIAFNMHHRSVLWLIASLNAVPLILANPVGFDVGPLRYLLPRQEPPVSNANFRNCPSGFDKIVMNALQDVQTLSKAAAATGTGGKYSAWFGSEIGGLTDKQIKSKVPRGCSTLFRLSF